MAVRAVGAMCAASTICAAITMGGRGRKKTVMASVAVFTFISADTFFIFLEMGFERIYELLEIIKIKIIHCKVLPAFRTCLFRYCTVHFGKTRYLNRHRRL